MVYKDLVSVTLVTYNSGRFIKRCLESVLEQKYPNLEVIIAITRLRTETVDLLEPADRCRIYYNDKNIGCRGAESAISLSSAEWF
jgi:glycosyltransferase involved in cell wall biosynthesis